MKKAQAVDDIRKQMNQTILIRMNLLLVIFGIACIEDDSNVYFVKSIISFFSDIFCAWPPIDI